MTAGASWRAVAYIRYSSDMQRDTWTTAAQRHEFEEFVASRQWTSAGEYVDEARRASSDDIAKRPAFARLLDDIGRRRFDVVVVHEQSRLARNQLVFQQFLKLCQAHGVRLVSIAEAIDTTTPDGEMLMGLLMQFSQHQSRVLGKHVAKAKKERVRQGLANGSVPFGYRRCDCGRGPDGTCRAHAPLPVADELAAARMAFERYATGGYTASDIARLLNERGFRTRNTRKDPEVGVTGPRPFGKESVVDMLRNPFHAGRVRYRDGELVPGAHEPAVSWELFERVQRELDRHARHGRSDRTKHVYLLNGLIRCYFCGERLWAFTKTVRRNRHGAAITPRLSGHYRTMCHDRGNHDCPSGDRSIVASVIDEQVEALVKSLTLPADWQALARKLLAVDEDRLDIERRRAAAQERLRRAGKAYADGNLDEADYERRKREAEAELASLVPAAEREVVDAAVYLEDLGRVWDNVDLATRRGIVFALFDAVYVDIVNGQVAEYRPKAAFRRLLLSRGGVQFGDPDGSRDRVCHFHRLVTWGTDRADSTTPRAGGARSGKLSSSERTAAAERVLSGAPLREVAMHFGVSHETLRRALRHEGVVTAPRSAPPPRPLRRERAYRLPRHGRSRAIAPNELVGLITRHHQGESLRSLARSVGVSHETMRRALAAVADT